MLTRGAHTARGSGRVTTDRDPTGGGEQAPDLRALGLVSALALEPGSYEIRVATEGPGGAAGSVHTFVDIPDFRQAPLSMSGVLLHVAPEEPVASRDEIDNALPFVPTARRTFASSDTVSAFVQVSQGTTRKDALQPVSLVLRIKDVRDSIAESDRRAHHLPSLPTTAPQMRGSPCRFANCRRASTC